MKDLRKTSRKYRIFRIEVIRRDKVCQNCGTRKNRRAHPMNNYKFFPYLKYRKINGICLCIECYLTLVHGVGIRNTKNMNTENI